VWREEGRTPVLDAFLDVARRVTGDGATGRGRPRLLPGTSVASGQPGP
jgi:hypothetical protein